MKKKDYKTPYGSVAVTRNIYKSRKTGVLYLPIDDKSGVIQNTTPRLAKSVTSKYVKMAGGDVVDDFKDNHALNLTLSYVQNITYIVGRMGEKKEDEIVYSLPKLGGEVATVSIGVDGTCSYVGNNGWRESMVGTISLYDENGDRLHSIYVAHAPEYGKEGFKHNMTEEIEEIKKIVPLSTRFVGLADGAKDNWTFLKPFVDTEIIDFYHVSEYLSKASKAFDIEDSDKQKEWFESACHVLKNDEYSALAILEEMKELDKKDNLPEIVKKDLKSAITYFTNHHEQMNYSEAIANNLPIGSGVTESGCKVIVKQRLCLSGARWSHCGANNVLKLRAINSTNGRWEQFWDKLVG
jgi:hypothetical protein